MATKKTAAKRFRKMFPFVYTVVAGAMLTANLAVRAQSPKLSCSDVKSVNIPGLIVLDVAHEGAATADTIRTPEHSAALTGLAASRVAGGYCIVHGVVDKRTGVGGQEFGIGFELRLPDHWSNRFLYQGGGGMDGVVNQATGAVPVQESTAPNALSRGFAVVSTDSGHKDRSGHGIDASFAVDQQARLDNGYAAIGRLTSVAKQILAVYYGHTSKYAYMMGCSNGGRQGLIAAQRFPELFDGIVSGAPAFEVSVASLASAAQIRELTRIAPKDANGEAVLSRAYSNADLDLLSRSILKACDANDGIVDGIIDNVAACHYDPSILECRSTKTTSCLSSDQVHALRVIFGATKDSKGEVIYPDWPFDAGVNSGSWRVWKLGDSVSSQPNALNATLMKAGLAGYFLSPPDPTFDQLHFDLDDVHQRVQETHAMQDATWTQMSTFSGHGGKLLLFHGMSDPILSAHDTMRYFDEVVHDNGGESAVTNWSRLFLVPGMTHCGGGPALSDFDPLTAIIEWVESGNAPQQLPAKGPAFPGRTRPLCPYPEFSRYKGSGSVDDARNFKCERP